MDYLQLQGGQESNPASTVFTTFSKKKIGGADEDRNVSKRIAVKRRKEEPKGRCSDKQGEQQHGWIKSMTWRRIKERIWDDDEIGENKSVWKSWGQKTLLSPCPQNGASCRLHLQILLLHSAQTYIAKNRFRCLFFTTSSFHIYSLISKLNQIREDSFYVETQNASLGHQIKSWKKVWHREDLFLMEDFFFLGALNQWEFNCMKSHWRCSFW